MTGCGSDHDRYNSDRNREKHSSGYHVHVWWDGISDSTGLFGIIIQRTRQQTESATSSSPSSTTRGRNCHRSDRMDLFLGRKASNQQSNDHIMNPFSSSGPFAIEIAQI